MCFSGIHERHIAHVTEAVFKDGVLRSVHRLQFREDERVPLIVERIKSPSTQERGASFSRFRERAEDGFPFDQSLLDVRRAA